MQINAVRRQIPLTLLDLPKAPGAAAGQHAQLRASGSQTTSVSSQLYDTMVTRKEELERETGSNPRHSAWKAGARERK